MRDFPDLSSPEFAPIKARLARAFIEHKAALGVPNASDGAILARVDDITALMLGKMAAAIVSQHPRLIDYTWFIDLINDLADDVPGRPLDG